MNCDSLLHLLEEIPLPLWSDAQRSSAKDHCGSCDACRTQLREQEVLFIEFENMTSPEPPRALHMELETERPSAGSSSRSRSRFFSNAALLFLALGSALQLFRETGFALNWFADTNRLESLVTLLRSSPVLSVALILVGLVYCLTRDSNGVEE